MNRDKLWYQHPPVRIVREKPVFSAKKMQTYHQADFEKVRCHSHQDVNFAEQIIVKWRHTVIVGDSGKEVHEDELTVSLATITRLPI